MNLSAVAQQLLCHPFASLCLVALAVMLAADTSIRLWTERHRLTKETLNDDDRAFAWRLVLFLVLPFLILIDWRAGDISALKSFSNYSGEILQILFALFLIPALVMRPHPFLATFLGYTIVFTLGLNFILHPALMLSGTISSIAPTNLNLHQSILTPYLLTHASLAVAFVACLSNSHLRMWFSDLSRPHGSRELKEQLSRWHEHQNDANATLQLGLLYAKAGLGRQSRKMLKHLQHNFPDSMHASFLKALLAFRQRQYVASKAGFIQTSEYEGVDGELRASLLAAAACAAFAAGETVKSLNLCDRALEFEDACLTARMVRVDAYLAQGKKEQAAQEIMVAMHLGLDFDLKDNVPLNIEKTYGEILALTKHSASQNADSDLVLKI
ncbi:MAG: hypothetical protein Q8T09_05105 [Candidatus Melainabacteria bacterium]|nr:hypothetical protein [Candidatus Melainabacteria bacterium]